jgi:hypothetical protein
MEAFVSNIITLSAKLFNIQELEVFRSLAYIKIMEILET